MSDRPTAENIGKAWFEATHGSLWQHAHEHERETALTTAADYLDGYDLREMRLAERIVVLERENAALRAALEGNVQPFDVED